MHTMLLLLYLNMKTHKTDYFNGCKSHKWRGFLFSFSIFEKNWKKKRKDMKKGEPMQSILHTGKLLSWTFMWVLIIKNVVAGCIFYTTSCHDFWFETKKLSYRPNAGFKIGNDTTTIEKFISCYHLCRWHRLKVV